MFYVRRGEVPHKRHTQFRKDDGGLYAEELFGVEGFSGRASLLYHHTPPTQTHQIEKVRDVRIEQSADEARGPHRHRLVNTKDLRAARRRRHRARAALLQRGRHLRRGAAGGADGALLPQRRGRRDVLRPHRHRRAGDELRADRVRPGRLPRHAHRHHVPAAAVRRRSAHAVGRVALGDRAAEALPQRLRPAARALPVLRARHPPAGRDGADPRGRRLRHRGQDARPGHRLSLQAPPVRPRRLGRAPVAVRLQHRRLRADHRARPPAAAGAPHLPAAQLRHLQLRAAQVRLSPARHPGAVQPLATSTATRSSTTSPATS